MDQNWLQLKKMTFFLQQNLFIKQLLVQSSPKDIITSPEVLVYKIKWEEF